MVSSNSALASFQAVTVPRSSLQTGTFVIRPDTSKKIYRAACECNGEITGVC